MDGTNLGTSAAIAAFLVPLVSLIKRPGGDSRVAQAIAMVAALVSAAIGTLVDDKPTNKAEFIAAVGTAFAVSQIVYAQYFGNTALNDKLSGI